MTEIVWYGRGGQGAFTASRILGVASTLFSDSYALSFPTFGPERRGTPVLGFTKIDSVSISDRSEIEAADFRIFLDETLLTGGKEFKLKNTGVIIVNTPTNITIENNAHRVVSISATRLAIETLGIPIVNTAMLGALAAVWNGITLNSLMYAIRHEMKPSVAEKNVILLNEVYNVTKRNFK